MSSKDLESKHRDLEAKGWLTLVFMLFLFPVLFFFFVFFPIWIGATTPY